MALDERRRSELFRAVSTALGEEPAATMVELLPSPDTGLATRDDVRGLSRRLDRIEHRLGRLEQRLAELEQRQWDDRFEAQRREREARFEAVRDELLAAFRAELATAVSGHTRTVVVASATAAFGIFFLAATLAQVL